MKSLIRKITPEKLYPIARKIYYLTNRLRYSGKGVHCPVCEKDYVKYLPGAGNVKMNSRCPGCGTAERHRLLWLYLNKKLSIKSRKLKLLDIAPDQAIQKKLNSLSNIDYTSVDLHSVLAMKKMDLTNLTFEDNTFDSVLCYHVMEHIEEDRKALSEIYRVLKNGGWAIIQSPVDINREATYEDSSIISPQERLKAFGQDDHVRIYGVDYTERLKEAGFEVTEDEFVMELNEGNVQKFGLDTNEIIYFCSKQ